MKIILIQSDWQNTIEHQCCVLAGFKCQIAKTLKPNYIGLGSVEFCRSIKKWPARNPYPSWLPWQRRIFQEDNQDNMTLPKFFKPFDVPKRFESKIMYEFPSSPWIASDIVSFKTEWRAYVLYGQTIAVYCYSDFDNQDVQKLPWTAPTNFCGTVDFGLTDDNRLLPVEVNAPYAIGWYGSLSDYAKYAEFVEIGWKYMINKSKINSLPYQNFPPIVSDLVRG